MRPLVPDGKYAPHRIHMTKVVLENDSVRCQVDAEYLLLSFKSSSLRRLDQRSVPYHIVRGLIAFVHDDCTVSEGAWTILFYFPILGTLLGSEQVFFTASHHDSNVCYRPWIVCAERGGHRIRPTFYFFRMSLSTLVYRTRNPRAVKLIVVLIPMLPSTSQKLSDTGHCWSTSCSSLAS